MLNNAHRQKLVVRTKRYKQTGAPLSKYQNRGIQLTSFDPKNVMLRTGKYKWPTLIQKKRNVMNKGIWLTSFDKKKRNIANWRIQLTSFDPKNATLQTRGSKWPPLIQIVTSQTGGSKWPFRCLGIWEQKRSTDQCWNYQQRLITTTI